MSPFCRATARSSPRVASPSTRSSSRRATSRAAPRPRSRPTVVSSRSSHKRPAPSLSCFSRGGSCSLCRRIETPSPFCAATLETASFQTGTPPRTRVLLPRWLRLRGVRERGAETRFEAAILDLVGSGTRPDSLARLGVPHRGCGGHPTSFVRVLGASRRIESKALMPLSGE